MLDFWDLTRLLWRRWYISAPMLLVAIGITILAAKTIEPDYVVTSYVQLIPPTTNSDDKDDTKVSETRNPWLDLGLGSLSKAAIITVQDQTVLDQLESQGHSINFTATFDTQMPVITFEVIGDSKDQATTSMDAIIERFDNSVKTLQSTYGSKQEQYITAQRLDKGDNVKESTSKVKRALVAIGGVGVLLSVGVTVAVDAWVRRRVKPGEPAEPAEPATPAVGSAYGSVQRSATVSPRTPPMHSDPGATQVILPTANGLRKPGTGGRPGQEAPPAMRPAQQGDATIILPNASQIAGELKNGIIRP
ncbi:hypothetical protein [Actinoplanes sp. NPDC051851]|uniref:hypothetical protein n=1 Tax=Actinoplanes sp. NPDC051851 TaxID=3154753 RepID=UPI0034352E12